YQDSNGDETVELEALKDIHLYSKVSDSGNFSIVLIFIAAGILILLIACINFMNLSTAKSLTRIKEIGIRKSTGANRTELIKQFLGESFIFSFFSMMLAVVLVGLLLPEFNELTGLKLTIGILFHLDNLLIIFAIWIITSLTAGSYPALYLSKFEPVDIMNGKIDRGAKAMAFRKLLVIVQFSIAIALIASTFIINDQLDYMINKDLGFNSNQVMVVRLKGRDIRKSLKSFKNELLANPEIKNVALSNRLPSLIGNYNIVSWENAAPDENISINFTDIEPDFIKTYDIKIIEGPQTLNEKSPGLYDGLLINETAAKRFGWKGNAVGKKVFQLYGNSVQEFKVLGVVKDFHYGSLRNDILPLKLRFKKGYFNYVSIKMATNNIEKNVEFVKQIWHKFDSKYPFNYFFMDEVFENRYKAEKNLREIFTYFSLLTLIVSCLGLLGLASFLATQKTKEIGIRKVLGASSNMIVFLLSKDFMKYVVISNLIAWPLAYFFMKNWLNEFAYKTSINPAVIVFAGVLALLTAFAAVGFQAYKASVANPVKSLRNE
ncbi:MAG: ABC transporter permease, partial [Rhodothermaceae bacterium]